MKITIESTEKIVELEIDGAVVRARIWQGHTASDIPVTCFITRISPDVLISHSRHAELTEQFDLELKECATPTDRIRAIPLRFIV